MRTSILLPSLLATFASAVCPGANFAIGNVQTTGDTSTWNVYDSQCNVVESLVTKENPCTSGMFGCVGGTFRQYTNSASKLIYDCRKVYDGQACGANTIDVCCRNDGKKFTTIVDFKRAEVTPVA
ncbi:hypothetical protein HBI31_192320 [Parastagonospora nodorum]|nr:hypothetical protein HBI11_200930 [Parastagonospora nodorum]KAH5472152.1 hypothetical protein HBI31_192320 [Parastagonospora nodorum]KAH6201572.1 hypothetical protein HBI15_186000 [Parastagonospora nodorum]KAH6385261.1 hypothetical protein HBI08_207220 [Parastagonospora nodorum]